MKRKILWCGLSFLVVAALVLSSCAKEVITPGEQEEEEEEVAAGEEEEEVVVPEAGAPQYGGTLSVQMMYHWQYSGIRNFDPLDPMMCTYHHLGDVYEHMVIGDIFGKGPRGTNECSFKNQCWVPDDMLTGCLAETWEVVEDPLRVVFHIRPGVYFAVPPHNDWMESREFTAYDAEFCYKRYFADPVNGKTGLRPFIDAGGDTDEVGPDRVHAIDKYTLEITLAFWDEEVFMRLLSGWQTGMYAPELVDAVGGAEDWRNVVGTGPWMLVDYVWGSYYKFDKNPNYWKSETINGKEYQLPYADHLLGPQIADESTQIAALRTGKIDFMEKVSLKYYDSLTKTCPDLVVYRQQGMTENHVGMRQDRAPFDQLKVRQAMTIAVDREAILKAVYIDGTIDTYPISCLLPSQYYTPIDEMPEEAAAMFEYNPEKARQLLDEAGYPDGFDTELLISSDAPRPKQFAEMLAYYWSEIGVNCKINMVDTGTFSAACRNKTFPQMAMWSGIAEYPVESMHLYTTPLEQLNTSCINDPWFSAQILKASQLPGGEERYALTRELSYYYLSQAFYINMPAGVYYTMHWPWVKNYYGEIDEGQYRQVWMVASMWIDQNLKAKMGY